MINNNFQITKNKENQFILEINEKSFLVGEVVYMILSRIKKSISEDEIVDDIKGIKGYENFTILKLHQFLENEITPLFNSQLNDSKNPVKKIFTVIKPEKHLNYFSFLIKLFHLNFFWTAFIFQLVISSLFIYKNLSFYNQMAEFKIEWFFSFFFLVFIMLIHELGHVVASLKFKIIPKEIGFGFYFIYPALYTNLTQIWKLNKFEKVIVNLGGIYFQLFINLILIGLFYWLDDYKNLLFLFFTINFGIILFNLNPFFKFDGYWVFSDVLKIPNLRAKANAYLVSLIKLNGSRKNEIVIVKVYAVLYFVFMLFIWCLITKYIVLNFDIFFKRIKTFHSIKNNLDYLLGYVITLILAFRIVYGFVFSYYKIRKNDKRN